MFLIELLLCSKSIPFLNLLHAFEFSFMSVIHFFQVINTTLLAFMSLFYLSKWIIV